MNEHDPYAGHSPVSMYSYDMYRLEEKIASQAEVIAQLVEALRYYASYYAWTIGEVEGPNGDYGRRGRAALAFAKGRGHG